jgi:hypothetical protein
MMVMREFELPIGAEWFTIIERISYKDYREDKLQRS